MADGLSTGLPEGLRDPSHRSAWAPFREPLFRSLWVAAVVSYTGTWMQNVGAGWLMTQLTTSPLKISLVTAAATLPVFLVILPAGALADIVDRRRFLLITQGWMVLASGLLGILTLTSCVGPWTLLLFTFLLGIGAVMNDPAWQAITPEIVCAENHAPAVALNSVGFNVARAVGPALGGFVVTATEPGTAFLVNSASFFGVIFFLYRWKRPSFERARTQRMIESLHAGFRYVRSAPLVHCVLIRLRAQLSVDGVVAGAIVVFALMTAAAGEAQSFSSLLLVLFSSGAAWIAILACLNVAAQTMSPPWMRARALSMYLLVLQGGMAIGSALWGALATKIGVPTAMLLSGAALLVGLLAVRRYRLTSSELQFAPSVVRD